MEQSGIVQFVGVKNEDLLQGFTICVFIDERRVLWREFSDPECIFMA